MRALFYSNFCPICSRLEKGQLGANIRIAYRLGLDMVNIHSGDPRVRALAEIFNSPDPNTWITPVIVFDYPVLKWDWFVYRRVWERVVIYGYQGREFQASLFNRLLKLGGRKWP